MSEPIQVTGGEWKWSKRRKGSELNDGSVFAMPHEGHAYTVFASPQFQNDARWEADARLGSAAANSYKRHCSDPVRAAEADLLGELLAVCRTVHTHVSQDRFTDRHGLGAMLKRVIAKAEGRQP